MLDPSPPRWHRFSQPACVAAGRVHDEQRRPTATRSWSVDSGSDACELSTNEMPAGTLTFARQQLRLQGDRVLPARRRRPAHRRRSREHRPGPDARPGRRCTRGSYVTACKPGMNGEGIRGGFTVTPSDANVAPIGDEAAARSQKANDNYAAYVEDQSAQLLEETERFVGLYKAGDDDAARALYPVARTHWERIETVAESFGDLDPRIDAREADLEAGQRWTGWHRIEKDLWPQRAAGYEPLGAAQRAQLRRTCSSPTHRRSTVGCEARVHGRPDRQRLPRAAGRGRDRQGHRRGGVLVAHRPVGLPGQRRRRAGRASRACGRSSSGETPSSPPRSRRSSPTSRRCWTRSGKVTASCPTTS